MNLFSSKAKKADVISHWYSLVPNFTTSTQEFYAAIEGELKARQVPGMEMARVEFSEGGLLSDKRTYLRMTRERLVFDVCAAPFGTSYFFSCRFAELPLALKISDIVFLFLVGGFFLWFFWHYLGVLLGSVALIALLVAVTYLFRNAVAMGLQDLDAALIKSPFGAIYELWFRKETYYRVDTRLMYHDLVNEVVKTQVETVTCANGIKLIRFNDFDPILHDLYKPTSIKLPRPTA